jgi:hypothetical protein
MCCKGGRRAGIVLRQRDCGRFRLGPYEILGQTAPGNGRVYRAKDFASDARSRSRSFPLVLAGRGLPAALRAGSEGRGRLPSTSPRSTTSAATTTPPTSSGGARGERARCSRQRRAAQDHRLRDADLHGLAAAHEKGIVHRDLKPETSSSRRTDASRSSTSARQAHAGRRGLGPATNLPTASAGTEPGVVMGTLGYMSPGGARPASRRALGHLFLRRHPVRDARAGAPSTATPPPTRCRRS